MFYRWEWKSTQRGSCQIPGFGQANGISGGRKPYNSLFSELHAPGVGLTILNLPPCPPLPLPPKRASYFCSVETKPMSKFGIEGFPDFKKNKDDSLICCWEIAKNPWNNFFVFFLESNRLTCLETKPASIFLFSSLLIIKTALRLHPGGGPSNTYWFVESSSTSELGRSCKLPFV